MCLVTMSAAGALRKKIQHDPAQNISADFLDNQGEPAGLGSARGCVVVIASPGVDTKLCGPELIVPGVAAVFSSFTVEQPDSDARAVAARHAEISFFIGKILVSIVALQYEMTHSLNVPSGK